MHATIKPIDILQLILDRLEESERNDYPEFCNSLWYAMAIRDLAKILWLNIGDYWLTNE